jgi:hypothetical protein
MRDGRPVRFSSYLRIRAPEELPVAVAAAAQRKWMSSSQYVRWAIIERLKKDGLDIKELSAA